MCAVPSVNTTARFRALLEVAAAQMESGAPAWEHSLAQARALVDRLVPAEQAEAGVRLLVLEHRVALLRGDLRTARGHLGEALFLVDDGDPGNAPMRFHLLSDLLQVHLLAGDVTAASGVLGIMRATGWEDPLAEALLSMREADIALTQHDYRTAQAAYSEAVEALRRDPSQGELLGAVLVSLATVQSHAGDADAAERTAAQARGLVSARAEDLAGLHEVDLTVARIRGDVEEVRRTYAAYREFMAGHGSGVRPDLHLEAQAGAALEAQAAGDPAGAALLYRELAGRQSSPANEALSLLRAAAATWDTGDHRGTFALLDDAAALLRDDSHLTLRASIEIYRAQFLSLLPQVSLPAVQALLPRVQAAAIVLHHLSFQVDTAPARREFARHWATAAVEVCCHLAFGIGDNRGVADMIDLVAATPAVRVAGPSLLISAPPRTRGLEQAYGIAAAEYGVRV